MFRIAVCDDSSHMRSNTKDLLVNYSIQRNVDFQIFEYESGESFLEVEKSGKVNHDLVFMDYDFEKKGSNGIDVISKLRKLNKDTTVIFLSSYERIVFESFKVDTFRFLVKPLDEEVLFEGMDAFIDSLASEAILTIRIAGENCLYPEKNITYVEGTGKNSILHFTDKPDEVMCSETLSAMEEKLSKRRFFRCHKSFLVNLGRVYSYNREGIKMSDGDSIMVSRSKYKEFGIALTEYLSSKRGL